MKREVRIRQGFKEVRLLVPDARMEAVRQRVAEQVARLDPADEGEALKWIEAVAEFDRKPSE